MASRHPRGRSFPPASLIRRGLFDESGIVFDPLLDMLDWRGVDALSEDSSFVGADFHVHTPASSCYKGGTDESEYLAILRRYREKGIRVVAITDHNTLQGYKTLMSVRDDLERRKKVVADIVERYPDTRNELTVIDDEIALFDELLVIPGVEVDANPGVHLLLLFDPADPLDMAEQFLVDAGYTPEAQGEENPTVECAYGVDQVLDLADDMGATVVAAHADRDKGVLKVLAGGYRARVLRHPSLRAISYCDPNTEQRLDDLLKQKEYRRPEPMALLKCSDYHGDGEVGGRISYLRLEENSWAEVLAALAAPVERVSHTATPDIKRIIEQLALSPNAVCYPDARLDDTEIARAACAILNSGSRGHVVFGVRRVGNGLTTMGLDSEAEKDLRAKVARAVAEVLPTVGHRVSSIRYGDGFVCVARFHPVSRVPLHYLRDQSAYVLDGSTPRLGTAPEIAAIVQEEVLEQIDSLQMGVIDGARRLAGEIAIAANATATYRMAAAIRASASRRFNEVLTLRSVMTGGLDRDNVEAPSPNVGDAGNVVIATRAPFRLPDAYLRLSAPMADGPDIDLTELKTLGDGTETELPTYVGPGLVIVPGGGVFYVPTGSAWHLANCTEPGEVLVMQLVEDQADVGPVALVTRRVALWLKSSLAIWYCISVLGRNNDHMQYSYFAVPVPEQILAEESHVIDPMADQMLALEHTYLEYEAEFYRASEDEDEDVDLDDDVLEKRIKEHNSAVQPIALAVDYAFAEMLGLDRAQMSVVYERLHSRDIYGLGGPLPPEEDAPES